MRGRVGVVVLVAVALCGSCGDGSGGAGYVWTRVDDAALGRGDDQLLQMLSVMAGGPGLVAVGGAWTADESAAVWVSPDGYTWERVPHDEAVFGGPGDQQMNSVTVGGPGLVAVGWDQSTGDQDAAVWVSPDGYAWTQVEDPDLTGFAMDEMTSVISGGPGLVAVGSALSGSVAAVWTSPDGLDWTRVYGEEFPGGWGPSGIRQVVAGGPGLVAVGVEVGFDNWDGAVWVSNDGLAWERVEGQDGFVGLGNQGLNSVAPGGPGLVAVGFDGSGPAVWTSADGYTWTPVEGDPVFSGRNLQVTSVAAGGPGLVTGGDTASTMGGHQHAMVWLSPDGRTWTAIEDEAVSGGPESRITSVTALGTRLVAVGTDLTQEPGAAGVWVAELAPATSTTAEARPSIPEGL